MTLQAKPAAMTNTKMTRSEKIVTGLAVAVLVAGFATGVFARPINVTPACSGIGGTCDFYRNTSRPVNWRGEVARYLAGRRSFAFG